MYIIYIKDIDISKIRGEINNPNRFITQVSLKHIHNVSNTKYSLSSGQFSKILCHKHWCLITDYFSETL